MIKSKANIITLSFAVTIAAFASECWADLAVAPAYTQQSYSPTLYDALLVIPLIAAYLLYRRNQKPDA